MVKKIALLNMHYSNKNYGAVLQAAALQEFLRQEGYQPINIKLSFTDKRSKLRRLLSRLKFNFNKKLNPYKFFTVHNDEIFGQFRDKWVKTTKQSYSVKNIHTLSSKNKFSIYIVGSDQVWRPTYTAEYVKTYFFDFVDKKAKKVAYAASFGMDKWELPEDKSLILDIKNLLNDFHAVSVREDSGVDICNDTFECNSSHVLDPTLLVGREYFEKIIQETLIPIQENKIVYYKLDPDDEFRYCLALLEKEFNISAENIYFKEENNGKQIHRSYNEIPLWLAKLRDAKLIVTDSYHCVCFALLFNKPFIHFNNKSRGNARLESLFKLLSIETDQVSIIDSADIVQNRYKCLTDFSKTNTKLEFYREKSANFLRSSLRD
jgi:hypothetical protein